MHMIVIRVYTLYFLKVSNVTDENVGHSSEMKVFGRQGSFLLYF